MKHLLLIGRESGRAAVNCILMTRVTTFLMMIRNATLAVKLVLSEVPHLMFYICAICLRNMIRFVPGCRSSISVTNVSNGVPIILDSSLFKNDDASSLAKLSVSM